MVSTAGGIVIAILVLLVAGAVGWVVFTQLRARRLGVCQFPRSSTLPIKLTFYLDSFHPQASRHIYHGIEKTTDTDRLSLRQEVLLAGSMTRFASSRTATTAPPQAPTSNPAVHPAAVAVLVRSIRMRRGTRALETRRMRTDTTRRKLVAAAETPDTAEAIT